VQTSSEPRFKKRVPCGLTVDGSIYGGMVLNVSRGGLFVQTSVGAARGDKVQLDLKLGAAPCPIPIGAQVVWKRLIAPHLRTVIQGGMGLRIRSAPESYYSFLLGLSGEGTPIPREPLAPPPEVAEASEVPVVAYRVRVKHEGGPRSRMMTLSCASPDEAHREALKKVGPGWIVLSVEA
jgi:Tfp pilus assembly protein PilZ